MLNVFDFKLHNEYLPKVKEAKHLWETLAIVLHIVKVAIPRESLIEWMEYHLF